MIEWLKTRPQDAKVCVLEHYSSGGYYEQGGSCYVTDFTDKVDHQQWKGPEDKSPIEYIYGDHFELVRYHDEYILQLGVKNK